MKYKLFLDDVRSLGETYRYTKNKIYQEDDWYIVRNYKEFVELVETLGLPEVVSFDHDLAEIHYDSNTWTESFKYEEETGYDCAKWLCDYYILCNALQPTDFPDYLIHSMNPVGSKNIKQYIENYIKLL